MIENIFFDFNGTLVDDVDLTLAIENEMMEKEGIRTLSKEQYLDMFCFPIRKYYHDVGYNDDHFDELCVYFFDQYEKRWRTESALFPDVLETLKRIKKLGYKIYCLSASEIGYLTKELKYFGIYDYFDGVCGAQDNEAKGKIEYGKDFVRLHNIDPKKTVMFGDTEHDYETSLALGFTSYLFSNGHNSLKVLKKLNAPICSNYKEIGDYLENYKTSAKL